MEEAARVPLVLVGGPGIHNNYCNVLLLPNDELTNGMPSRSTAADELHLFKSACGVWLMSRNEIDSDPRECCAAIRISNGGLPPSGEAQWSTHLGFRDTIAKGDSEEWMEGPMKVGRQATWCA